MEHGRPLRIAVDEADWVYNNVTKEHVARIRQRVPEYRGIEKNIFYRICNLLRMNMQLLFVFDSPDRPPKRGRRHGVKVDPRDSHDLKEVLRAFRIPFHQAKGEAEAECVRLQQLGVVDAVWSQDSDCLLFGCNFLMHDNRVSTDDGNQSKGNTVKDSLTVRVIHGSDIRAKHNLDNDGLLLFAMLCGGDFNPQGVKNCGRVLAARAVRDGVGVGLSSCQMQAECLRWSGKLVTWLARNNINNVELEARFPDINILSLYNKPKLYSDDELLNLECLQSAWNQRLNETMLFELTGSFFNIWAKDYLKWIGPILLTRWLVEKDPSKPCENAHRMEVVKQHTPKGRDGTLQPRPSTLKVRFSPFGLTSVNQWELMNSWTKKGSLGFDAGFMVEVQIPIYLLERALPRQSLIQALPANEGRQKRTRRADTVSGATGMSSKKQRAAMTNKKDKAFKANSTARADAQTSRNQECISLLSDSEDDAFGQARNRLPGPSGLQQHAIAGSEDERLKMAIARSLQDSNATFGHDIMHKSPAQSNQVPKKSNLTSSRLSVSHRANSKADEVDFIDLTL